MRKKITVLDAYTVDFDDDLLRRLEKLGEVRYYADELPGDIYDLVKDSNCIFTDHTKIDKELIDRCHNLEYIGVMATGTDSVDVKAAAAQGIAVTNVPAYSAGSVAQHTFALILTLADHMFYHTAFVKDGSWSAGKKRQYWNAPHMELKGKTLGILGYGNISKEVIKIAAGFGMNILVSTDHPDTNLSDKKHGAVEFTDKERLIKESDIISMHKPYTKENINLIGKHEISLMKKDAMIVCTSRGGLIDENALAEALESGQIRAAALDVMDNEPPDADSPLLSCHNCLITPHVGFAGENARRTLRRTVVENYSDFLEGKSTNRLK